MRILMAHDLTPRSDGALRRAAAIAADDGAELRIIHSIPASAPEEAAEAARNRLEAALAGATGGQACGESGLSIRVCRADAADIILSQAAAYEADLIVLGGHGAPRLRDAMFGTTAGHVARRAAPPVLIVQNDPGRPYRKMMIAVDDESAEQVLDLALSFASPDEIHIVHAFGTALQAVIGAVDPIEDVRTEQDVLVTRLRRKLEATGRKAPRIETIVEEGDEMDVIMRAWNRIEPDLVVMGTHGRTGIAHFLHDSLAETALLGCPSDMLIIRTGAERQGS
jgi:universal stress protein E